MLEKYQNIQSSNSGFTLIELLIVVIILSIISSIVVPQIVQGSHDAEIATVQNSLRAIQKQLDIHHIKNGSYPTFFDSRWFRGYKLPKHPLNDGSIPEIHYYVASADRTHPVYKVMDRTDHGAYWYNKILGVVRSRVPMQETEEKTLDLYNLLNQSSLTSMSQTND